MSFRKEKYFFYCSHVGDLGNLVSNPEGVIIMKLVDPLVSLVGPLSVIGRAFVVRWDKHIVIRYKIYLSIHSTYLM